MKSLRRDAPLGNTPIDGEFIVRLISLRESASFPTREAAIALANDTVALHGSRLWRRAFGSGSSPPLRPRLRPSPTVLGLLPVAGWAIGPALLPPGVCGAPVCSALFP